MEVEGITRAWDGDGWAEIAHTHTQAGPEQERHFPSPGQRKNTHLI